MPPNTEYFKQQLLAREQELSADISRLEEEARNSRSAEVEDTGDQATSDENKAASFQAGTAASATLAQVRDALSRIDEGTYGICLDCGRAIEPARLQAVPWTPYCLADQEKHDQAASSVIGATL